MRTDQSRLLLSLLLWAGALLRYAEAQSGIIINPIATTTTTTTTTTTVTITTTTITVTSSTVTTKTATITTTTVTPPPGPVVTSTTQTATTTTTTPACILEKYSRLGFADATRGRCVDENKTEVQHIWRGSMTDAECACACKSEEMCESYAYIVNDGACAMYGYNITGGWPTGTRLWNKPEGWYEGVLWGTPYQAWFVGEANSSEQVVAGRYAFGEYAAEPSVNDWSCRIKINITLLTLPPDNARFMCPLGENSSLLACSSQAILVIFFCFIAPFICCCSFILVLISYLKKWDDICSCLASIFCGCRRPKRGKERCGEFGRQHGKLGWHLERHRQEEDSHHLQISAPTELAGTLEDDDDDEDPENPENPESKMDEQKPKKRGWFFGRSGSKKDDKKAVDPKKKTGRRRRGRVKTHVVWDLDALKVAEAIGARALKAQQNLPAIMDDKEVNYGQIPDMPNFLTDRAIPASSVDLGGFWGNFKLTCRIQTSEQDGVIIGKLMKRGEEAEYGAPKVLMLHDGKLRWVVPNEDGELEELEGHTFVADDKEHLVGIVYDRGEDRHTLIVDGQPDGCMHNMPLSEDNPDSRLVYGDKEWPTHWNFVTPNGRFHFFGAIYDIRWNGGIVNEHLDVEPNMPPTAFVDDEDVEYYSKTHGMWMLGRVNVNPADDDEMETVGEVNYTVLMPASKQSRSNVTIDFIRLPMSRGEACEVYSVSRGGNRWKHGEVAKAKTRRSLPSYMVRPVRNTAVPHDGAPTLVTSSVTRRRFLPDMRVFIYHEPVDGWTGCWTVGTVMSQTLADQKRGLRGWAPGEDPDAEPKPFLGRNVTGPVATNDTAFPQGASVSGPEISTASSALDAGAMTPVRGAITSGMSGFGLPVSGQQLSTASSASSGSKLASKLKTPKDKDGAELGYWTMIPVQEEGSDRPQREVIPSFRLRVAIPPDEDNPNMIADAPNNV